MNSMFFSKTTNGFYDKKIHGSAIPSDAVEITYSDYQDLLKEQSIGKQISSDEDGYPIAKEPEKYFPTKEEVEKNRLFQYSNPITGSDRYFSEAMRLRVMGAPQKEIDAATAMGSERYAKIQEENPWPI